MTAIEDLRAALKKADKHPTEDPFAVIGDHLAGKGHVAYQMVGEIGSESTVEEQAQWMAGQWVGIRIDYDAIRDKGTDIDEPVKRVGKVVVLRAMTESILS